MMLLRHVGFELQWLWCYCDMLVSNGSDYDVTATCWFWTAVTMMLLRHVGFEWQWLWCYYDMLVSNGSDYDVTATCWFWTAV